MNTIHARSSYKALELEVKKLKKELYMFKKEFIKTKQDGENEETKGAEDKEEILSRSTMDNMLEACLIFGHDWRYLYLNDTAAKQCRRPKNELQEKVFTEVWPGIENTKVFSLMKDCLENGIPHSYVNKYEFPDKSEGWYDLKIRPVPEGVFVLSNEITKQKLAEMEVEKLKKELIKAKPKQDEKNDKTKSAEDKEEILSRSTMDNMLEACLIFGHDWRYLYLNDTAAKQCRRPKNELQEKVFTEVWPGIENTKVFSLMKDCLENRTPHSYVNKYEFPDKSEGWYDLKIGPVPEGVFVLSNEITKQKLAEMEVEKLKKEFSLDKEG